MLASPKLSVITIVNPVYISLYLFKRQLSAEKVHTSPGLFCCLGTKG